MRLPGHSGAVDGAQADLWITRQVWISGAPERAVRAQRQGGVLALTPPWHVGIARKTLPSWSAAVTVDTDPSLHTCCNRDAAAGVEWGWR